MLTKASVQKHYCLLLILLHLANYEVCQLQLRHMQSVAALSTKTGAEQLFVGMSGMLIVVLN